MKKIIISCAIMTAISSASVAFAETVRLRAECDKINDKGCTAHQEQCYTAPQGKFIKRGTISDGRVVNHWKKNPTCGAGTLAGYITVEVEGLPESPAFPTKFCSGLHIESGSGFEKIGTTAFVDCDYDIQLFSYP